MSSERPPPFNLALGVERLGLISLRYPWLALLILAALSVVAALGIERIKVDDSLSQLFRSDTAEFRQFEEVTRRFPSSEFDVLLVVEGRNLMDRQSIEKLRDLVTDLQLIDGVRGLISLFSARQPPEGNQIPKALFPAELPEGAEYEALKRQVLTNEIIRGKLLSEDGTLALVVLALDPAIVQTNGLNDTIGEIRKTMAEDLAGAGVTAQLSGVPVMQLEIRTAVERDRLVYNTIGFIAGCAIAILFFRRISFMIIAAAPPLIAILLSLGALGWLDFRLNMFLNVMTPLIMVISFSDSMQLTFAARDRLIAGEDRYSAFRNAVLTVGPACVLTHCTAGLSFVALQFSSSDLIRTFGEAGLLATVIALIAVLTLVPLLGVLLIRHEATFAAKVIGSDAAVDVLRRFCRWVAVRMVSHAGLYSLLGLLVVGGLTAIYIHLEPRYRLADQVPDKRQAVQASERLDAKLTGANPVDVLIQLPKGAGLYDPATLSTIAEVHSIVEKQAGVGNVWSLELAAALARRARRPRRRRDAQAIRRHPARASYPAVHIGRAGRSGGVRPHPGCRCKPSPAGHRAARPPAQRRSREASRLHHFGHRPLRDRRPQQRDHDRQAQPGAHGRDHLRVCLHRARLPVVRRHAGEHPARDFPCRARGHVAVADG